MMGRSPRCYIPSFVEISSSVPEKKNFEGFLPYMGVAAKFQDHRTSGSGEEDFQRFLPYMGVAAILYM